MFVIFLLNLEPSAIITWALFKHNFMSCLTNIWSLFFLGNYLNPLILFYNKFLHLNLIGTFKNKNLTPGLHFYFRSIDIFCWRKRERKWRSNLELLGPIVLIVYKCNSRLVDSLSYVYVSVHDIIFLLVMLKYLCRAW